MMDSEKNNQVLICLCGGPGMYYPSAFTSSFQMDGLDIHIFNLEKVYSNIEEAVSDLNTFLRQFRGREVSLLGHSFGGILLVEFISTRFVEKTKNHIIFNSPVNYKYTDYFKEKYNGKILSQEQYLNNINDSNEYYKELTLHLGDLYFNDWNEPNKKFFTNRIIYNFSILQNLEKYMSAFDLTWKINQYKGRLNYYWSDNDQILGPNYFATIKDSLTNRNLKIEILESASHFFFIENKSLARKIVKNVLGLDS